MRKSELTREKQRLLWEGKYRLPTVREAASMMSFPIDYWFYGKTKSIKHTLVGNAVPPLMAQAIANRVRAMLEEVENE